jgi:hypothetical protein
MRSLILAAIGVAAILVAAISVAPLAAASSNNSSETNKLLAELRKVTAKYHNPASAIADGYIAVEECVPQMGYHYVNYDLAFDLDVTELQPEVVLYAPTPSGLKLVAVEYFVVALANTPEGPMPWFEEMPPEMGFFNPAPELFDGKAFDGPMPGHEPEMPWHYDLHVWVWNHNPDGMFTDFNPRISCNN